MFYEYFMFHVQWTMCDCKTIRVLSGYEYVLHALLLNVLEGQFWSTGTIRMVVYCKEFPFLPSPCSSLLSERVGPRVTIMFETNLRIIREYSFITSHFKMDASSFLLSYFHLWTSGTSSTFVYDPSVLTFSHNGLSFVNVLIWSRKLIYLWTRVTEHIYSCTLLLIFELPSYWIWPLQNWLCSLPD